MLISSKCLSNMVWSKLSTFPLFAIVARVVFNCFPLSFQRENLRPRRLGNTREILLEPSTHNQPIINFRSRLAEETIPSLWLASARQTSFFFLDHSQGSVNEKRRAFLVVYDNKLWHRFLLLDWICLKAPCGTTIKRFLLNSGLTH